MISAQIATPRGQRKPLRAVIERVEGFLDGLSEEFVAQLRRCEASQLVSLSQAMGMLEELSVQESECEHVMALVTAALDDLACCSDPVTRATALLSSIKQSDRHRGLALLSSLDRRMLEKPEEAEVSAVAMVVSHLLGESVAVEERTAAWMAVSVLTLRNTVATIHSHAEAVSRWGLEVLNPILEGCVQGPGIFRLLASSCAVFGSLAGQAWATNNAVVQAATDKAFAESLGVKDSPAQQEARASLLYGKFPELLPAVVQGLGDADLDLAAGIAGCLEPILHLAGRYGTALSKLVIESQFPSECVRLMHRIVEPRRPLAWWTERIGIVDSTLIWLTNTLGAFAAIASNLGSGGDMIPKDPAWDHVLNECFHILRVNEQGNLLAQAGGPVGAMFKVLLIVQQAARDASRHPGMLSTGVAQTLLHAADPASNAVKYACAGVVGNAELATEGAIALVGRNESGLTLSREAVKLLCDGFGAYFGPATTEIFNAKRLNCKAQSVLNAVIADVNKSFVVEHEGAIDALVSGLLLEDGALLRLRLAPAIEAIYLLRAVIERCA